jgi:hypothetical protein
MGPGPTTEREKTMQYMTATNPREWVTVDYSGFHGPVVSAWVYDNNDIMQNVFCKSIQMLGYECESDWHDEDGSDCDCVTEDTYIDAYMARIEDEKLTIVEEDDNVQD